VTVTGAGRRYVSRSIALPLTLRKEDRGDIVFVLIDPEANREWCLNLCLLREGLIESLTIIGDSAAYRLGISLEPALSSRQGKVQCRPGGADVSISITELDYWLHFFLKYHRHGVGDINHIDVETPRASPTPAGVLTWCCRYPMPFRPFRKMKHDGGLVSPVCYRYGCNLGDVESMNGTFLGFGVVGGTPVSCDVEYPRTHAIEDFSTRQSDNCIF
jgi:hypothetical protein